MRAVDERPPEPKLADDFVQRALADEEFFGHVAHAVESGAGEREQVTLELVAARDRAVVGSACDVVAGQQDAHPADADQDACDLRGVVAHVQEQEGNHDDEHNGPEVDQLRREDRRVPVREHREVVTFHVEEGEDDVWLRD